MRHCVDLPGVNRILESLIMSLVTLCILRIRSFTFSDCGLPLLQALSGIMSIVCSCWMTPTLLQDRWRHFALDDLEDDLMDFDDDVAT